MNSIQIQKYLIDNRKLLIENKIKEFFESVYNDPSLNMEEKADVFTFVNNILKYFNQPNSYNVEYIPEGMEFSDTLYIGEGNTKIGDGAFTFCTSLESVVIPNSVTEIGEEAFDGCDSLQSIVIPNSVKKIGNLAFWGCKSLQSIVIPDSVTEIGDRAFGCCFSLQSINLPKNLRHLGKFVFTSCKSLKEFIIPESLDPAVYEGKILKKPERKFV